MLRQQETNEGEERNSWHTGEASAVNSSGLATEERETSVVQEQARVRPRRIVRRATPVTRLARRLAITLPLLYGLFTYFCVTVIRTPLIPVEMSVLLVLPGALAILLGFLLCRRRYGAMAGILTFACMVAGIMTANPPSRGEQPGREELAVLLGVLTGGAILGAFGAFLGTRIASRRQSHPEIE